MFDDTRRCFRSHHAWGEDMPFGKWFGGHGPWTHGAARFERGGLKLTILDLLKDQPRHGYDIIQALEERFHGFYSPSPGSVYPILQLLEDQDYVSSDQQTGKKVYTITEEGKKFLNDNEKELERVQSRAGHPWGAQHLTHLRELRDEMRETAQLVFRSAASGALSDAERMKRIRGAFQRFRSEVETILSDKESKPKAG